MASESDAEQLLALNKRVEESGFMLYDPGEKQMDEGKQKEMIRRFLLGSRSLFLVAESGGMLAGFLAARGETLNRIKHRASIALGVDEDFQGQGIATALFNELFVWAKRQEIKRLELTVIKHNEKAINLYRKMGFSVEGEKIHSLMIDGKPVNEYFMYKLIEG
ncbi:N-acetyltransferase family protein [Bacillus sp. 1P06AnD]|uniref:GNAT family N-acetyltransferase n=1 Tax=Bacillus sp. 1P06AnD TaxID=3132208 RepID=UPI0039A00EC6